MFSNTQRLKTIMLICIPLVTFLVALTLGKYLVSIEELILLFKAKLNPLEYNIPETVNTVIFQVRLPRIIASMVIGAALSVAGAAYQGIFKNPLVSPDILGASAGASFGAALAILFSWGTVAIQLSSFIFGLIAVLVTYGISTKVKVNDQILILVLMGMLTGTLFSSFISIIKYVADPYDKLPAITFWLMGSLASIKLNDIYFIVGPMLIGGIPIYLLRWRLNLLTFGDEEAQALGVDTRRLRLIVILCSTLMTSAAVAISGMIGWVGLVIPHLTRAIVGPNYKFLLPTSILVGSTYLLLVDTLARILLPTEVPLGVLTSLIGAPFFILLLSNSRRGWN